MITIESRFIERSRVLQWDLYTGRRRLVGQGYRLTLIEAVSESTWRGAYDY